MKRVLVPALAAILTVAGCGPHDPVGAAAPTVKAAGEAGFEAAPRVVAIEPLPGGGLLIRGEGAAGAPLRLASPDGRAFESQAAADGVWTMRLVTSGEPGLFGLSSQVAGRPVQAEGYVALAPGAAALLRPGSGARRIGAVQAGFHLDAVDIDASGGAVVSGYAAPGAAVTASVDGAVAGESVAGASGAFSVSLVEPVGKAITVRSGGAEGTVAVAGVRPSRPAHGPYAIARRDDAWRIDWMTPGGGLQTTLLLDRAGGGA